MTLDDQTVTAMMSTSLHFERAREPLLSSLLDR